MQGLQRARQSAKATREHEGNQAGHRHIIAGCPCPGFVFAIQSLKISIAAILSRYRVAIAANARIDYRSRITLSPYPGIPVILRSIAEAPAADPIAGRIHELVQLRH